MNLNNTLDKLTYPVYVLTQIMLWGLVIYLIGYYDLTFGQAMIYFFTGDLLSIAFIVFAIVPNALIIMSRLDDKDGEETNTNKAV